MPPSTGGSSRSSAKPTLNCGAAPLGCLPRLMPMSPGVTVWILAIPDQIGGEDREEAVEADAGEQRAADEPGAADHDHA